MPRKTLAKTIAEFIKAQRTMAESIKELNQKDWYIGATHILDELANLKQIAKELKKTEMVNDAQPVPSDGTPSG